MRDLTRRVARGIEKKDIPVGERKAHARCPVPPGGVAPARAIGAHDDPGFGRRHSGAVREMGRQGQRSVSAETLADQVVELRIGAGRQELHGRSPIPGAKGRDEDAAPVGACGEGAGCVRKEGHDFSGPARIGDREDPHVGAPHPRHGQLRVSRPVLPAVRGGDEGALSGRPGKDDVARLVTHRKRGTHVRPLRVRPVDHRDTVGEVVHHPGFTATGDRNRDRLEDDHPQETAENAPPCLAQKR
jgi:hypothetical protein